MFNVSRYKHDRRQRKVSFPKLIYQFSARQVQHIDAEKQNIVRVPQPFWGNEKCRSPNLSMNPRMLLHKIVNGVFPSC